MFSFFFFFNDTATTEIYTLSLHDALPISAHAVEAGQHDRVGRVVDDEVHAGEVLQRADVASLAADHASLHVVAGQLHDRHRRFGGMRRGQASHTHREDVAHSALGLELGLLVDL